MNYILMNFSVILSKIENILQKLKLWFLKSQYTLLTYNSFNLKPLPRANLHIDSTASNTLFASWPISSMIRTSVLVAAHPSSLFPKFTKPLQNVLKIHSPTTVEEPFLLSQQRSFIETFTLSFLKLYITI